MRIDKTVLWSWRVNPTLWSLFVCFSLVCLPCKRKINLFFFNSYFSKTVCYPFPFQLFLLSAPYCSPSLPLHSQITIRIFNTFYFQSYARSPVSYTTRKRIPPLFCVKGHLCDNATNVDKYADDIIPKGNKIPIFFIVSYSVTENKIFK